MVRTRLWCCLLSFTAVAGAAKASTTGQIALRGVVPVRAAVTMVGLPKPMVVDFQNFRGGTAVFHLDRFTNSGSGVTVSLASTGSGPALRNAAGESIPYMIRFAGQNVDFNDGSAELSSLSRAGDSSDTGDELQIVAPLAALAAEQALADRLILTITAR